MRASGTVDQIILPASEKNAVLYNGETIPIISERESCEVGAKRGVSWYTVPQGYRGDTLT